MVWLTIGLFWLFCSFLVYGINFAYFWNEYKLLQKYVSNRKQQVARFALLFSLTGPFGLVIAFFGSDCCKHGIQWRVKDAQ